MHTLSKGVLKLTAQLPPIGEEDDGYVNLQVRIKGAPTWTDIDSADIGRDGLLHRSELKTGKATLSTTTG